MLGSHWERIGHVVVLAGALLACKQGEGGDGAAGASCSADGDCKNGFLCEQSVCMPKDTVEKARAAGGAVAPATAAAPAPAAAAEKEAPSAAAVDEKGIPLIPSGRSKPPTVAEWSAAPEVSTQEVNSRPAGCFMKIVREWLKVHCEGEVTGTDKMTEFGKEHADFFQSIKLGKSADFVVRLRQGRVQKLHICHLNDRASLFVNWPAGRDRPIHVALGKGPVCGL